MKVRKKQKTRQEKTKKYLKKICSVPKKVEHEKNSDAILGEPSGDADASKEKTSVYRR